MSPPLGVNRRNFYLTCGASLLLSIAAFVLVAYAQSTGVQSGWRPAEVKPYLIERRQIGDGPKADPWLRFELRFGEAREKCRTWRFETRGQADGHAVFDLKEPVDKSVILELQDSPQHLELVLGNAECSYRIRIERNK